jgi:hypothetical protein
MSFLFAARAIFLTFQLLAKIGLMCREVKFEKSRFLPVGQICDKID